MFTLDTVAFESAKAHLGIWRQPCLDDTGSVVLVRVTPTRPATSIRWTDFTIARKRDDHPALLDVSSDGFFSYSFL